MVPSYQGCPRRNQKIQKDGSDSTFKALTFSHALHVQHIQYCTITAIILIFLTTYPKDSCLLHISFVSRKKGFLEDIGKCCVNDDSREKELRGGGECEEVTTFCYQDGKSNGSELNNCNGNNQVFPLLLHHFSVKNAEHSINKRYMPAISLMV